MMDMFLSDDEIRELTNRRRSDCQVQQLRSMGVEHRSRADGSIAVLRSHVVKIFGGIEHVAAAAMKRREPNWDAVR